MVYEVVHNNLLSEVELAAIERVQSFPDIPDSVYTSQWEHIRSVNKSPPYRNAIFKFTFWAWFI